MTTLEMPVETEQVNIDNFKDVSWENACKFIGKMTTTGLLILGVSPTPKLNMRQGVYFVCSKKDDHNIYYHRVGDLDAQETNKKESRKEDGEKTFEEIYGEYLSTSKEVFEELCKEDCEESCQEECQEDSKEDFFEGFGNLIDKTTKVIKKDSEETFGKGII